jgi:hypothetical protein
MADVLVQGDTGPLISGYIHEQGQPNNRTDLTNATVKFQMRRVRDLELMVDNDATIDVAASGTVYYNLEVNDTAYPGDYQYQWQVTFPDGKKQTTYEAKELTIRPR